LDLVQECSSFNWFFTFRRIFSYYSCWI